MKKVLFILLCSFVSFAFTNEKIESISVEDSAEVILPMEVKTYPIENGTITIVTQKSICDEGVTHLTLNVDCGDGGGYSWSGYICNEHVNALADQFLASC